jgi:hypothetical protein
MEGDFMRIILAALVAAVVVAAPAEAWDRRDGIANARLAGIKIGPGAERAMAGAPRGSCANDPTQIKCPPIRAVRLAGKRSGLARATIKPQCAVRLGASPSSPYKAGGYAQADGHNQCYVTVTWHELFTSLYKFKTSNNQWTLMDVKTAGPTPGGGTIHASARYACESGAFRAWHAVAEAYALLQGILYAEVQDRYHNLYCS